MTTIIVDLGTYHARTNLIPPKTGPVSALFTVAGNRVVTEGDSFDAAVNLLKKTVRLDNKKFDSKIYRITLLDVRPGLGWKHEDFRG